MEGKLRACARHRHPSRPLIRALSSVNPALGLIAACQSRAIRVLAGAGRDAAAGICALDAAGLEITASGGDAMIKGVLRLVPTAASSSLLLLSGEGSYLIPLAAQGVTITPAPSIGFRAAGLADITLSITVREGNTFAVRESGPDHGAYLAIALGAGDYLSRRAMEHAAGRVQFPGQMLDTGGRDGIAKLGAVKAMIARVEAWRLLLETLYDASSVLSHSALRTPHSALEFGLLSSTLAALAFGPENGCMAYDAGQVFGGFAYSEDDLLSRFYRDSALYRFLLPVRAAARFYAVAGRDPALFAPGSASRRDQGRRSTAGPAVARSWKDCSPRGHVRAGEALRSWSVSAACSPAWKRGIGFQRRAEAAAAEVLLGLAGDALLKARLSAGRSRVAPAAVFPVAPEGARVVLEPDYEAFCTLPGRPHRSGEFLISVFDRSPRYVPEIQLHDAKLRSRWNELADWFRKNCSERSYNGLPFERHVERLHNLPPEIVQAVKDKRWLATYIPKDQDGLGWRKAEYYILNSAAGSFGDAGLPPDHGQHQHRHHAGPARARGRAAPGPGGA
jgi:alkylation response protein AidB-like acyl-CoA dehydrogenase